MRSELVASLGSDTDSPNKLFHSAPQAATVPFSDFSEVGSGPANEQERRSRQCELAKRDPLAALQLAEAEPNWRLRSLLRNAALSGWASRAPADAAEFALQLPEQDRREAFVAVFQGAANDPQSAAYIAADICIKDPTLAEDHGRALIDSLASVGAFKVITQFASADTTGHRTDWLNISFSKWAERDPAAARLALEALPDPNTKAAAFQGLAHGWSMADPTALATYATTLPQSVERSMAIQQSLAQWVTRDPTAVAGWVMHFDPGPDFDLSAATLATQRKFASSQPAVALGWAQSIVEPALRNSTLTALSHQWAREQPENARRVIEQMSGLLPADREILLAGLNDSGPLQE